jgi:hypothetical protein
MNSIFFDKYQSLLDIIDKRAKKLSGLHKSYIVCKRGVILVVKAFQYSQLNFILLKQN